MKKPKKTVQSFSVSRSTRSFRAGVLFAVLLVIGAVTAIAKYKSGTGGQAQQGKATSQPGAQYLTVDVGGRKLQVNAHALQQGPLTQDQAQQIADALKDNQSADGLVQMQNADGSVLVDLQGRFQNVILATKNSDGSVDQACVDNSESASAFLQRQEKPAQAEAGQVRRVVKEQ